MPFQKMTNIKPDPAVGIKGKPLSWLRLILPSLQGRFANVSYFASGGWLFLFASGGWLFLFASGG